MPSTDKTQMDAPVHQEQGALRNKKYHHAVKRFYLTQCPPPGGGNAIKGVPSVMKHLIIFQKSLVCLSNPALNLEKRAERSVKRKKFFGGSCPSRKIFSNWANRWIHYVPSSCSDGTNSAGGGLGATASISPIKAPHCGPKSRLGRYGFIFRGRSGGGVDENVLTGGCRVFTGASILLCICHKRKKHILKTANPPVTLLRKKRRTKTVWGWNRLGLGDIWENRGNVSSFKNK